MHRVYSVMIVVFFCAGLTLAQNSQHTPATEAVYTANSVSLAIQTPTADNLPAASFPAITAALSQWNGLPSDTQTYSIVNVRQETNWALLTLTSSDLSDTGQTDAPEHEALDLNSLQSLLLINNTGQWQAALESDREAFLRLTQFIPDATLQANIATIVSDSELPDNLDGVQQQYSNYKLPFPNTHDWYVTQSWHSTGYSFLFPSYHAIDFDIGSLQTNSDILAMAPGVVDYICAGNARQTLVAIETQYTSELLGYLHIDSATLTVQQGDMVQEGQVLGQMREGYVSDACGTSYGTHLHMYFPTKPFTMCDYTFTASYTYPGVPLRSCFGSSGTPNSDIVWDFASSTHSWTWNPNMYFVGHIDDGAAWEVTNSDPWLETNVVPFRATNYDELVIKMASQNDQCGQFYWSRDGETTSGDRRIRLDQYMTNVTSGTTEVRVPLDHPNWRGVITHIRIDPACHRDPNTNGGVRLNEVRLTRGAVPLRWDFGTAQAAEWDKIVNMDSRKFLDGGTWMRITNNDPWIEGPHMTPTFSAADYPLVHIRMGRQADTCGEFFWRKSGQLHFQGDQYIEFDTVNTTRTYTLNLSNHPQWTGDITELRLDPACYINSAYSPNTVRLDWIELEPYTIRVSAPVATVTEGSSTPGQFKIRLNTPNKTGNPLTIDYVLSGTAVGGDDYQGVSGSVTIADNAQEALVDIIPIDDPLDEDAETIELRVQSVDKNTVNIDSANDTATVTLEDNDTDSGVPMDMNNDGIVSPTDVIYVINRLESTDFTADADGDSDVDIDDVTAVSNALGN